MQMEAEAVYQRCVAASDGVNKIVAMFNDVLTPMDMRVHPKDGTVVFGSALHGWSFTIWQFAKIYAAKLGLNEEKLLNRMWGDCFWHARKKSGPMCLSQKAALSLCSEFSVSLSSCP